MAIEHYVSALLKSSVLGFVTFHDIPKCVCMCVCAQLLSHVQLSTILWTVAHQAPLSMEFYRQESWSGFPSPPPGDLPNTGIKPVSLTSPALAGRFFTTSTSWEVHTLSMCITERPWSPPTISWSSNRKKVFQQMKQLTKD